MEHQTTAERDLYSTESTLQRQLCESHPFRCYIGQGDGFQCLDVAAHAMAYRSFWSRRKLCVRPSEIPSFKVIYHDHDQDIRSEPQSLLESIECQPHNAGIASHWNLFETNTNAQLNKVELDKFKYNDCQRWNFIPDGVEIGTNIPTGMRFLYIPNPSLTT